MWHGQAEKKHVSGAASASPSSGSRVGRCLEPGCDMGPSVWWRVMAGRTRKGRVKTEGPQWWWLLDGPLLRWGNEVGDKAYLGVHDGDAQFWGPRKRFIWRHGLDSVCLVCTRAAIAVKFCMWRTKLRAVSKTRRSDVGGWGNQ